MPTHTCLSPPLYRHFNSGRVKLVVLAQTSPLNETRLSCKFFPHVSKMLSPTDNSALLVLILIFINITYYPLANEVAKGYSNATVCPSVTSL
jgi:hypothetical protein